MEIKAKVKHIRMSPRKVRLVADVVRGLEVNNALDQLKFIHKKATKPIEKLINSAIAGAVNNYELDKNNLKISEIRVDEGATLKRWMPRAHGRATTIRKRTSHINLTLAEIKDSGTKKAKKQEIETPVKLGSAPKKEKDVKVDKNIKKDKKINKKEVGKDNEKETEDKINDPRMEGRGGPTRIEGKNKKSFTSKIFRRKSG